MENQPLVSVILPTYSRRHSLQKSIESVFAQSYRPLELIIVNDASTDGTRELLESLAKNNPAIVVLENPTNMRIVVSLNKGIAVAKGKYIARLDDDDVWCDQDKIKKQVEFLEKNPEYCLVGGGMIRVDSNDREIGRYMAPENDGDIKKEILVRNMFVHTSVMFRKDTFEKTQGYNQQFIYFEDWELWLSMGKLGKFYNFPEYFVRYLDQEQANSAHYRNRAIRRNLKVAVALRNKYKNNYPGYFGALAYSGTSYLYSFLPWRQTIKKLFTPGKSLSQKAAQGTVWLFGFRIVDQSFRLIKTIVLARLLAPSDFGLFGISVLAVSLLDTFSQSGFHQALIQKKDDIASYLDTGWLVQVARSFILGAILFSLSGVIAWFFGAPGAQSILRWVALAVALQGLVNISVVYFSRELQFHKYFFYQISGTLTDAVVSCTIAATTHNVYALVFGLLAGNIARVIISYIAYPRLPRLVFNLAKARELFGYGKWILSSNIIGFFLTQIDSVLVGKIAGVASLGFYQVSYKIPSILGSDVLTGAIFPAYARMQDSPQKMKEAYLKILQIFCFMLIPAAAGICAIAPEFITLFLGVKWMPSLWPMRILSISVVIWSVEIVSNHLFLAIGKPHIETKWNAVRFVIMVILLYPFIMWWGIIGAALAVAIGAVVGVSGFSVQAIIITEANIVEFLQKIFVPVAASVIMVLVIMLCKIVLPTTIWSFLLYIFIGALAYFTISYVFDQFLRNKTIPLLKESLRLLIK